MELKPGYKQTEVGVVPEDWERKPIESFSAFVTKGATPTTYGFKWEEDGVLFLRSECISDNGLNLTQSMFISQAAHAALNRGEVRSGDVLITITGNIGRVVLLKSDFGFANINQHIARIRVKDPNVLSDFVYHFLSQPRIKAYYTSITTGQAYPQISLKQVRETKIPLPLPSEQHAIASALGDVDALIGVLDRLIAKKRDFKQAAMQQLLTCQNRLPGFHGKWELKRLRDVAEMGSGGTPLSSVPVYYDGDIPWVSISDMTKGGKVILSTDRNLTNAGFANSAAQMFPVGTVLYAMYASLGECSIAGISLCSSQAILGIRPKDNLDKEFLYYFLTSLKPVVKAMGQHGTQANLNKGMVQDFQLRLPLLPEQTAIAAILSDMDAEIAALEARRDKTRALKQGMMQELLTGRTRLV